MFLLYGATGYSGRLIAEAAVERGLRPVLAGRRPDAVAAQAAELGLRHRAFRLEEAAALEAALDDVPAVLHCAGPFAHTWEPMVAACLRTGTHYLDITGEVRVFAAIADRDAEAGAAGVMLLPGVGFDVVPTDCLAARVKRRLPTATSLVLAFQSRGRTSRGTAATAVDGLGRGGLLRRGGALVPVPAGDVTRRFDFGAGPVTAARIPWGDLVTAYHTTGIGDIEVYAALPAGARRLLRAGRWAAPLLRRRAVQRCLARLATGRAAGPTPEQRARGWTRALAEARDGSGRTATARLHGPDGYTFTVRAALAAVEKVLGGRHTPGFRTPALEFGEDFVLELEGVRLEDVP